MTLEVTIPKPRDLAQPRAQGSPAQQREKPTFCVSEHQSPASRGAQGAQDELCREGERNARAGKAADAWGGKAVPVLGELSLGGMDTSPAAAPR